MRQAGNVIYKELDRSPIVACRLLPDICQQPEDATHRAWTAPDSQRLKPRPRQWGQLRNESAKTILDVFMDVWPPET